MVVLCVVILPYTYVNVFIITCFL